MYSRSVFAWLVMIGLAVGLTAGSTGCPAQPRGDSVPTDDTCSTPSTPTLDSLELGVGTLESVFEPWQDGDSVSLVRGAQGSDMIAARFRLVGTGDLGCVLQQTAIANASQVMVAQSQVPLRVYPQDDGSYVTDTHWVVFSDAQELRPQAGDAITIRTAIGNMTTARSLILSEPPQATASELGGDAEEVLDLAGVAP